MVLALLAALGTTSIAWAGPTMAATETVPEANVPAIAALTGVVHAKNSVENLLHSARSNARNTSDASVTYGGVVISPDSETAYLTIPADNEVAVLNLATDTFGTPIPVGMSPKGLDITPDGTTLYVADSGASQISEVDLATGEVTNTITTPGSSPNSSLTQTPWQIAIGDNGTAVFTTTFNGSGYGGGAYTLNLTSDAMTSLGAVTELTRVTRSADRSTALLTLGDESQGTAWRYSFGASSVLPSNLGGFIGFPALDGNGSVAAINDVPTTTFLNSSLQETGSVAGGGYGVALNSAGTIAYSVTSQDVAVINTSTYQQTAEIPLPENTTGAGQLALSPDGSLLVAILSSGVAILSTNPTPPPAGEGTVSGSVAVGSSATSGVCVYLTSDFANYEAITGSNGSYSISVPPGTYTVLFDPTCDETKTSAYALQWYADAPDFSDSTEVAVQAGQNLVGVGASLQLGASISGSVTSGSSAVATACVDVYLASNGSLVNFTESQANGSFSITNLPAASIVILFDPTCNNTQASSLDVAFYNNAATFDSATPIVLTAGVNASGINANLVAGASITGSVDAIGAQADGGICVYAVDPSTTDILDSAVTSSNGTFDLSNLAPYGYYLAIDPSCQSTQRSDYLPGYVGNGVATVFTLSAGQSESINVSFAASTPPSILTRSLPTGTADSPYAAALASTGGIGPYLWSAVGLPAGLNINSSTGTISGTPTTGGPFSVQVTLLDSSVPAIATTVTVSDTIVGGTSVTPATSTSTITPSPEATVPVPAKLTATTSKIAIALAAHASRTSVPLGSTVSLALKLTPREGKVAPTGTITVSARLKETVKGKSRMVMKLLNQTKIKSTKPTIILKISGLSVGNQTIVIAYSGNSKYKPVSTSARLLIVG